MVTGRVRGWGSYVFQAVYLGSNCALTGRGGAEQPEPLQRLPLLWLIVVLGFFSLAVSRLEHYSLPALPALALLVGHLLAHTPTYLAGGPQRGQVILLLVAASAALLVTLLTPTTFLTTIEPTLAGYGLESLVKPALLTFGVGLLSLALCMQQQW